jgi:opacity protein-like surface antigen
MRLYKTIVGGLIMICSIQSIVLAQSNSCEEQLSAATAEFEAGRFYGIPSMLAPCIDKGFTREQRQRAFLLLTQAYLLLDDPIGADNSYLEVLRANPEFLADTARDQIDVVYLSKRFTADPIFSLSGRIGGNFAPVRVISSITPSGEPGVENKYKLRIGWQAGIGVDWHLSNRVAVTAEFNYAITSYKKDQVQFSNDLLEFTDKQNWLSIPLGVKYTIFTREQIRPYVVGGYAFNLLFSDQGQVQISKRDRGEGSLDESSPEFSFNKYRQKINTSFFVGAGAKYKVGINFLFAEMRYNFGLTNVVTPTTTYNGPAQKYGHVDDYFRMDNFSISVGYIKPLYKPRKVKRVRTKSVLKGIKKQGK